MSPSRRRRSRGARPARAAGAAVSIRVASAADAGGLVLVAPGRTREAFATVPGTAVLVVGARPGVPFTPSAWEERQLRAGR
jgi:hypothetical protein